VTHEHDWERGAHMAEAFGISGRIWACAICGTPKPAGDDAERVLRLLTSANTTQPDMAFVLGMSIRAIQASIVELRLAGHPVITSGDGVRLAQTADEARACADALRRRLVSQYRTVRALRATARRMQEAEDAAANVTLWDLIGAAS
jgi:biotin operon repressor